jgi:hypothetical protein
MVPSVPVIRRLKEPVGVVLRVETVSVEDPEAMMLAGTKDAVAPAGKPLALKLTVPA